MHKALVLVLTQDTKKGLIDTSGGGSGWGPWEGLDPFYTFFVVLSSMFFGCRIS